METCENCGLKIGELETPHVVNDSIVCGSCRDRIAAPAGASVAAKKSGDTVLIRLALSAAAVIAALWGYGVYDAAPSAIQQLGGLLLWLIAAVLFSAACIIHAIVDVARR